MPGNPPVPLSLIPPPGWIDPHDWSQPGQTGFIPPYFVVTPVSASIGDTTGQVDTENIQNALNTEQFVCLAPSANDLGVFNLAQPLTATNSSQVLQGLGYGFTIVVLCQFTVAPPATANGMLVVDPAGTGTVSDFTLRDLTFRGGIGTPNAFVGNLIVMRTEAGFMENVIAQRSGNGGDCFHFSWDGLATTPRNDLSVINCYAQFPSGAGFLTDSHFNSNEFYGCHANGNSPIPNVGGTYGYDISGGATKLTKCHAFAFTNGGGIIRSGAEGTQVSGGEWENNGGPGWTDNGTRSCFTDGMSFYGAAIPARAYDLVLQGNQANVADCSMRGTNSAGAIQLNGAVDFSIHHNKIVNTANTGGIAGTSGQGNTRGVISGNTIQIAGSTVAIAVGDLTHYTVSDNRIVSNSTITETAGGDWGTIYGNDVTNSSAATPITASGVHTNIFKNPGNNPEGLVTAPAYTSGVASTNTFNCPVRVYVTGSTATSVSGNATGLGAGTFLLEPNQTITPTGPGSWVWLRE